MKSLPEIEKRLNEIQELVEEEFKDLYRVSLTIDKDGYRNVVVVEDREGWTRFHSAHKFGFSEWKEDKEVNLENIRCNVDP